MSVLPRSQKLEQLRDPKCTRCSLHASTVHRCVMSRGSPFAQVVIIGEAPGEAESLTGMPFMGRSGQLMDKAIDEALLDKDTDVYVTNVCKCRPPNNRKPSPIEVATCTTNFLDRQLLILRPKVLMLMGKTPIDWAFKGKWPFERGRAHHFGPGHGLNGMAIIPTWHPSYCLRMGSSRQAVSGLTPYEEMVNAFRQARISLVEMS